MLSVFIGSFIYKIWEWSKQAEHLASNFKAIWSIESNADKVGLIWKLGLEKNFQFLNTSGCLNEDRKSSILERSAIEELGQTLRLVKIPMKFQDDFLFQIRDNRQELLSSRPILKHLSEWQILVQ